MKNHHKGSCFIGGYSYDVWFSRNQLNVSLLHSWNIKKLGQVQCSTEGCPSPPQSWCLSNHYWTNMRQNHTVKNARNVLQVVQYVHDCKWSCRMQGKKCIPHKHIPCFDGTLITHDVVLEGSTWTVPNEFLALFAGGRNWRVRPPFLDTFEELFRFISTASHTYQTTPTEQLNGGSRWHWTSWNGWWICQ